MISVEFFPAIAGSGEKESEVTLNVEFEREQSRTDPLAKERYNSDKRRDISI